jgi:hypothetical protein
MVRRAGILAQCRPVVVEADKKGDASPKSFAFLDCAGRTALSDS